MVSKTTANCSIVVESDLAAITGIWRSISRKLQANKFSKEEIFAVHLAFEETFVNAVKHGNKGDVSKKVKIDYCVNREKAEITITDEGSGFNPSAVPDPRCDENIYKTDGRGLLLIRSYMDAVEYNGRGNVVHLVKYKGKTNTDEREGAKLKG